MMGIKEVFSLPYYPQANGLVERLFGTAKSMMKLVVRDHRCDWDDPLPVVNLPLRNSVNRATGYTPYEVLFAKRARLPLDWQFPEMISLRNVDVSDYIISLHKSLQQIENYARKSLNLELKRQADYYNKNSLERKLNVGDRVLVRESRNNGRCKKYKYYGPFFIQRKLGEWTYELIEEETGNIIRRSHNQVKRYTEPVEREEERQNDNRTRITRLIEKKISNSLNNEIHETPNVYEPQNTNSSENQQIVTTATRRSTRVKKRTERYGYDS